MRRGALLVTLLSGSALMGCGDSPSSSPTPPVPHGAKLAARSHECPVTPQRCFDYDIVTGGATSSPRLKAAQMKAMQRAGWTVVAGVTPKQTAACAPSNRGFVSVATGSDAVADDADGEAGHAGLLWSEKLRRELEAAVRSGKPVIARTHSQGGSLSSCSGR